MLRRIYLALALTFAGALFAPALGPSVAEAVTQVNVWPALGTTVTLQDGVTTVTEVGAVLTYTSEVRSLISRGRLLTHDPRPDSSGIIDYPTSTLDSGAPISVVGLESRAGEYQGQVAAAQYYDTGKPDGGGLFRWDGASTADEDGCTVFGDATVGRWFRIYAGSAIDVRWCGAVGDGVADDRAAIELAEAAVIAAGGGIVLLPTGDYLLSSLSTDDDAYSSFLTPHDGVHWEGAGKSRTRLLVGTNWKTLVPNGGNTGPMVFGLTGKLSNASFRGFTIDWNGALLQSGDTRRNFAGVFASEGGFRLEFFDLEMRDNPGNQYIFLNGTSNDGQGFNTVERCDFVNGGSGLTGNYNYDHSSVYMYGYGNVYRQNRFTADNVVYGAPFEIHGSYGKAIGNYVENYQVATWLGADFEDLDSVLLEDNDWLNVEYGPSFSRTAPNVFGIVTIERNRWEMGDPADFASYGSGVPSDGTIFIGPGKGSVDELRFVGNTVIGRHGTGGSARDVMAMQLNLTKRIIIQGNTFSTWSRRAISHGATALPDGTLAHEIDISGNTFEDCIQTAYIGASPHVLSIQSADTVNHLHISDNVFKHSTSEAIGPLVVNVPVDTGHIVDNSVSPNMTLSMSIGSSSPDVYLRHAQERAPGAIYAALGSTWRNLLTGEQSTKEAATTAWVGGGSTVSYTPTFTTAGGGESLGDGILRGHYFKSGNVYTVEISLEVGSTTNLGAGAFRFALPATPSAPRLGSLSAYAVDVSTNTQYIMAGKIQQSVGYVTVAADGVVGDIHITSPITWAVGDRIVISGSYVL